MTISEIRRPAVSGAADALRPTAALADALRPTAASEAAGALRLTATLSAADELRQDAALATTNAIQPVATTPGAPDEHAVETWHRREPPLPAVAVLAVGAVASDLAAATHLLLAEGAALRTVADAEYLVVLGDEATLPWVDGARYLGWDGAALTLTTHRVLPSADLWRSAALAAWGGDAGAAAGEDQAEVRLADPDTLVIVLPEQVLIAASAIVDADPAALAALFAA